MQWIDTVKNKIPDYSKDIKLNLEFTCLRSSIKPEDASAIALAAAVAAGGATGRAIVIVLAGLGSFG